MSEGSLDHRLFETIKNRSEIAAARKGRGESSLSITRGAGVPRGC